MLHRAPNLRHCLEHLKQVFSIFSTFSGAYTTAVDIMCPLVIDIFSMALYFKEGVPYKSNQNNHKTKDETAALEA